MSKGTARAQGHATPGAAAKGFDCDLLVRSCTLATLEGPNKPRDKHEADNASMEAGWSVAVGGGRILWVGPDPDWKGKAARVLDAQRKLVTPGYVDSHTHLVYGGERSGELKRKLQGQSYQQILAAGGGIMSTVRATREATDNELGAQALTRLKRMNRNGTTTVEAKSGYGLTTKDELRILGTHPKLLKETGIPIVSTFLGAHAVPEEFVGRTDAYVDLVVDEMIPKVAEQNIARFCDVFVDDGAFTVEQGERVLSAAKKAGFQLRMHADELVNTGAAELAGKVGCYSADHLLQISKAGIQALADNGVIATLAPTVPLTLMNKKWAPAQDILEALVPVAIATDHNPNNPVLDLQFSAQMASYAMGMTPAQALTAVTWNAACALNVEDNVGSIEVGKRANLVIHDIQRLEQWTYELGRNTARHVIQSGKLVPMG